MTLYDDEEEYHEDHGYSSADESADDGDAYETEYQSDPESEGGHSTQPREGPIDPKQQASKVREGVTTFLGKIQQHITEEQQNKLYVEYEEYIRPQSDAVKEYIPLAARNVLYKIALDGKRDRDLPEAWVVSRLARDYPKLLEDGSGERALFVAIANKMVWFVEIILDSKVSIEILQRILGPTPEANEENNTSELQSCITEAIKNNMESSVLTRLIEAASEYTLAAQDQAGKTPLHYAVEDARCKDDQLNVIEAMLKKGDKALDKFTGQPFNFSVYQYHLHTRTKQNKALSKPRDRHPRRRETRSRDEDSMKDTQKNTDQFNIDQINPEGKKVHFASETRKRDEGDAGNEGRVLEKEKEKALETKRMDKEKDPKQPNESGAMITRQHSVRLRRQSIIEPSLDSVPEGPQEGLHQNQPNEGRLVSEARRRAKAPSDSVGPLERKIASRSKPTKTNRTTKPSVKSCSNEVAQLLKLHYLRTTFRSKGDTKEQTKRNHNSAERFLFGDNPENKSLCFTFPPKPPKESTKYRFESFKEGYESVSFDSVLLYVNFGSFSLQTPDRGLRSRKVEDKPTGKQDLGKFFEWLSKEKNVRYIIKVMVDDKKDAPHCDEIIIKALKRFDVEILDWRKIDLCPLVIQEASQKWQNFHELHLWWSGSNAVLRSWSEPDGLAKVKSLKSIHIYEADNPLDSRKYIDARIEDFKERLNASRTKLEFPHIEHEDIKHHRFDQPKDGSEGTSTTKTMTSSKSRTSEKIDTHQWLNIMDTFADGIRSLQAKQPPDYVGDFLEDSKFDDELKKEVTVALIDDGVDFMNPALSSKLIGGKCFPSGFGDHDVAGAPDPPYHGSTTEHGTNMAYMISRICPAAKIFVCKIDVMRRPHQKANFTAKSAADAIEFAVKQGFDIISMSWSIKEDDTDTSHNNDLDRIKAALKPKGNSKTPLLFCSAPDIGESSINDMYYPFGCTEIQIFKIGAATAAGNPYQWTGGQVNYILPGEKVPIRKDDAVDPAEQDGPLTGSSVATALAAGLAALIIHIVRLGAIYNAHKGNKLGASYKTLEVADGALGGTEKRLGVEKLFESKGKQLKRKDKEFSSDIDDGKWGIIEGLVRDLVPRQVEEDAIRKLNK